MGAITSSMETLTDTHHALLLISAQYSCTRSTAEIKLRKITKAEPNIKMEAKVQKPHLMMIRGGLKDFSH